VIRYLPPEYIREEPLHAEELLARRDAADKEGGIRDESMTLLPDTQNGSAHAREGSRGTAPQSAEPWFHHLFAPAAGAVTFSLLAGPAGAPYEAGMLAFLAFFFGAFLMRREGRWTSLLTFMALVSKVAAPLVGALALAIVSNATHLPGAGTVPLVGAFLAASIFEVGSSAALQRYWVPEPSIRVAVIGSANAATSLARELELASVTKYTVVGRIGTPDLPNGDAPVEVVKLGDLNSLGELVAEHQIHLLVMTSEVPRLNVFNEIAASCLHLPVRLWELAGFYEDVFGHVPVAEINASWFQYIMHPNYRSSSPASKRALDILVALVVGALSLPLMLLLSLLIRRDGGPVLYRQARIGEGGRPFTVYKLRTMRMGVTGGSAQWADVDDPRITKIGRLLRRTHLDEFPQLINVLKGEMSIVGPRPEQPEFVDRLERWVPFYTRRHLLKPGITGWAQVRCGYAGSDFGSAWKLCHDLYYLKHRSMALDLVILGETLRTLIADRQYAVEPANVSFILDDEWLDAHPAVASS
jgi:exopolysaccharide biosynthesis polyprenyl glycosylphosphotransferase